MATKTTTKKAEPKAAAAKAIEKEAPVKTVEPAEEAAKAAVTVETPAEPAPAKKRPGRKPAAKKVVEKTEAAEPAEKKPAAKRAPRKTAAAKTMNTEVYVQFWGKEVYAKDVVESIKKIWTEEMGKKESELTDLKVYIKPEDNGAHYVINGEITGFIGL